MAGPLRRHARRHAHFFSTKPFKTQINSRRRLQTPDHRRLPAQHLQATARAQRPTPRRGWAVGLTSSPLRALLLPAPRFDLACPAASCDPPRSRPPCAAAMDNLITLVNKLQRACTALGDHGEESALPTLWDSLPAIAVVGGQVPFFAFWHAFLCWFWSDLVLSPSFVGVDLKGCWWNREG